MNSKHVARLALSLAALIAAPAFAEQVDLVSETGLMSGHQSFTYEMKVDAPGDLTVSLVDLKWQGSLANLSFSLSDGQGLVSRDATIGSDNTGKDSLEIFHITKPGTYYGHVSGDAEGRYHLGLYGLEGRFQQAASPVPLPATAFLLVSGLAGLAGGLRRKKTVTCDV